MDKPTLQECVAAAQFNPTFILGLPGFGNVGRIAAHLLIKQADAHLAAELYSPTFPDYVTVNGKGICTLPRYEFYAAALEGTNFVVVTGETQPSIDDVQAHYEVCEEILNYAQRLGCQFLITVDGIPQTEEKNQIYVAATTRKLAAEFQNKGAAVYGRGRIVGETGLALAMAKERGIDGVSVLAPTNGYMSDKDAGLSAFKFLMKVLGKEIKEASPETL